MIEVSDAAAAILTAGQQIRYLRAEAWLDDELLDDDVPVAAGTLEIDRSLAVPERLTLSVPAVVRGANYTPVTGSPLAADGQRLRLQAGVGIGGGQVEWLQLGWFVILSAERQDDTVAVTAAGMLSLIQEARLVNPFQPTDGFVATVRSLVEPALTVDIDAGLTDRSVPASVNLTEDRLANLNAVLDAWPAVAAVTADGYLSVVPAGDSPTAVAILSSSAGGTVIRAAGTSTREGVYNAVVATGTDSNGAVVRGVAYDTTGPKAYGGAFNPLPVPFYFDSPLLTTTDQAQAAAETRLATIMRTTVASYDVTMVPNPALQVGDRVLATDVDLGLAAAPMIIEHLSLPLTADGGEQTMTIRDAL